MKKILFAFMLMATALLVNAQAGPKIIYPNDGTAQGQPRFGNGTHGDNTGNSVTYKYVYALDKTGADTLIIPATASFTNVLIRGNDGILMTAPNSQKGNRVTDELTIVLTGTTGSESITFNANFQLKSSGALVVGSTYNKALIKFIFDGKIWIEQFRQTL